MNPSFSCITVTAGRHQLVEEAIAMFARQDYEGDSELIILNTCPQQQLELNRLVPDHDNVRIINLATRPESLGYARNMAVASASNDWVVTWDDDDVYLPWHLRNFAEHAEGQAWLWQSQQFYLEGYRIKGIVAGTMNVVAFRKGAWSAMDGYNTLSVGEDRAFVGKLTASFQGTKINLTPDRISFGYGWGQSIHHVSGLGDDKPGLKTAWRRAGEHLEKQIAARKIPTGTILLQPQLRHDYEAMARRYIGAKPVIASTVARGTVAIVMLGRYGDIINVLPIAKHIADHYEKPSLVVAREFASVLDGVSYVCPYVLDTTYDDLRNAITLAERKFKHVIVAQVYGKDYAVPRLTDSYNLESWRTAGFLHRWHDPEFKTVFDLRNKAREEALCIKLEMRGKRLILYKLDEGASSPFHGGASILKALTDAFGDNFTLVDLSNLKCERLYDLLGLFDRAAALVTIDTSILHLAAASTIPFAALVNPTPWLGTVPRGNCIARFTYTEAITEPGWIVQAIKQRIA